MKKTIELTLEQARYLYGKSKEMDQLLLANFKLEELTKEDWEDITTYDKALCSIDSPNIITTYDIKDVIAYKKMRMIIKALNPKGWKAQFDGKQKNWCIYWSILPSGGGFSGSGTYYYYECTDVGSRLWFASKERAEHFIKYFTEIARPFYELQ